ncbi:MAG: 2-oxoacid:acceptor oxidoreductase family protein [Kineosporiaceae bacterium]
MVFQLRIHGRGGQGVVTAAELVAMAAFLEGRHAQAFPSFGSERTGAPVVSFCRIDDRPIRVREPIDTPDAVVIADPTLVAQPGVLDGLVPTGFVLVNSEHAPADLGLEGLAAQLPAGHLACLHASAIAREHVGRPLPNAVLVAALAALTGIVGLPSVRAAVRRTWAGEIGERNVAAATAAHALLAATTGVPATRG